MTGFTGGQVIGSDFSGTVIASKSSRFRKGEEVFGVLNAMKGGAYSELLVANEENAAIKPSNISFAEAASLAMVSLTAWQGMVYDGNLKQGNKVLILGCTGGVGSAAVQIAKSFGAQVTGTCSEKHMDYAKMLGCDRERTNPTSLVVRAISGGISSASVARKTQHNAYAGALAGGVAAVVATYGMYYLRKGLTKKTKLPGFVLGLLEDAVVVAAGAIVSKIRNGKVNIQMGRFEELYESL